MKNINCIKKYANAAYLNLNRILLTKTVSLLEIYMKYLLKINKLDSNSDLKKMLVEAFHNSLYPVDEFSDQWYWAKVKEMRRASAEKAQAFNELNALVPAPLEVTVPIKPAISKPEPAVKISKMIKITNKKSSKRKSSKPPVKKKK
jgi:hypothetical protein